MNTLKSKIIKVVGVSTLLAAFIVMPYSTMANQSSIVGNVIANQLATKSVANFANGIQLAHRGHGHGGWHGHGWHGGGWQGGGWHGGGWHGGGVRIYWSPWLLYRPGYYYNKRFCQKRCWWKHGHRQCYVRCYRR